MKLISLILVSLFALCPLVAQQTQQAPQQAPQEIILRVQNEQFKTPVVPATIPQAVTQSANEWVQLGTNVGSAIGSGLKSVAHETKDEVFGKDVTVLEGIDKLSKTDAGRFTMAVIAWKVAGREATELTEYFTTKIFHIVFGVPILIGWNLLAIWFYRRMFLPRRVVISSKGNWWAREKVWKVINEDDNWSGDKTAGASVTAIVWTVLNIIIICSFFT